MFSPLQQASARPPRSWPSRIPGPDLCNPRVSPSLASPLHQSTLRTSRLNLDLEPIEPALVLLVHASTYLLVACRPPLRHPRTGISTFARQAAEIQWSFLSIVPCGVVGKEHVRLLLFGLQVFSPPSGRLREFQVVFVHSPPIEPQLA